MEINDDTPISDLGWARYKVVIEAISAVSALAFVISGVANATIFAWHWRLNYFSIASPADIIMSAFVLLTPIALLCALFMICLYFTNVSFGRHFKDKNPYRNILIAVGLFIAFISIEFVGVLAFFHAVLGYDSNLKLSQYDKNATYCGANSRVMWTGSDATIIHCREGVIVLRHVQDLVLRQ